MWSYISKLHMLFQLTFLPIYSTLNFFIYTYICGRFSYFSARENSAETPPSRPSSNWTPLIRDTQLELYLSGIENELLKINEDGKNYPNLSKEERSALQDLMKDENIIIKPADKGSAIVIWDRKDYLNKCNKQLNNENIYEKCNEFPAVQLNKEIRSTLSNMLSKKEIDKKVMNYLIKKKPQL